jgi:hypothetical protein
MSELASLPVSTLIPENKQFNRASKAFRFASIKFQRSLLIKQAIQLVRLAKCKNFQFFNACSKQAMQRWSYLSR